MKHIFLIVIVLLLLYKTMLQKPEEGFSFTEKDIMSSYGLRGTLTRDKQGKICKLKPKKRMVLEKQSEIIQNEKQIDDLKKQFSSMGKTNVEEDVEGEDVEGEDVEGEELDTNVLPPNIPMNNETEFQGLLSNLSMKIDTFDKQIEDKMDSQFKKTNPNKALNAFMETMKQNEQKEIDQIKELNNQIKLLDSQLKNTMEKDKVIDKLIDKISASQQIQQSVPPPKSNVFMYVMIFFVLLIGGVSIYFVMNEKENPLGEPMSFNEAVIKAKYNLLKRSNKI